MRVPARSTRSEALDTSAIREELLRNLRMRSATAPSPERRLQSLARVLSRPPSAAPPPSMPSMPAMTPAAAVPLTPVPPRPPSVPPDVDMIVTDSPDEVPTPQAPLFDELRRHTAMLQGENHLVAVAKFLSAIAEESTSLPELLVLASRAWLAAGEKGHARFFARRLVEDVAAPDEVRLMALEIMESTAPTQQSQMPPPMTADPIALDVLRPAPIVAVAIPSLPPLPASATVLPLVTRPPPAELVETMPLVGGVSESMLGAGDSVRTVGQAHVAMTRLARALAKDYRLAYGTTLKTDPMAIEAMQRQLRRRFGETPRDDKELLRHGALFSEILVRSLGAQWEDVEGDPARWVMIVPPSTRVSPIGRVMRFFERGHRESDLLAYYFELEKSARGR